MARIIIITISVVNCMLFRNKTSKANNAIKVVKISLKKRVLRNNINKILQLMIMRRKAKTFVSTGINIKEVQMANAQIRMVIIVITITKIVVVAIILWR